MGKKWQEYSDDIAKMNFQAEEKHFNRRLIPTLRPLEDGVSCLREKFHNSLHLARHIVYGVRVQVMEKMMGAYYAILIYVDVLDPFKVAP